VHPAEEVSQAQVLAGRKLVVLVAGDGRDQERSAEFRPECVERERPASAAAVRDQMFPKTPASAIMATKMHSTNIAAIGQSTAIAAPQPVVW